MRLSGSGLCCCLMLIACTSTPVVRPLLDEESDWRAATTVRDSESMDTLPWPGEDRYVLAVPDELYADVLASIGLENHPLGLSEEEMHWHYGSKHVLPKVKHLFTDIRTIATTGARISQIAKKSARDPAELVRLTFGFLDAFAARNVRLPNEPGQWIWKQMPNKTTPDEILARFTDETGKGVLQSDLWELVPEGIKRFAARLLIACEIIQPDLVLAYDPYALAKVLATRGEQMSASLASCLVAPFILYEEDDLPVSRASLEAPGSVDLAFLCRASAIFSAHVDYTAKELQEWLKTTPGKTPEFDPIKLSTPFGPLMITDGRSSTLSVAAITIDLGGDDIWKDRREAENGGNVPSFGNIELLVDLGGNDRYESEQGWNFACGDLGIGMLFDFDGDDVYDVKEAGLGCGIYGTGMLVDYAGNDTYRCEKGAFTQAAALVGTGMLIDLTGKDTYYCGVQSQGYGGTLGMGLLYDEAGNDSYVCSPTAFISPGYKDRPLSLSQGCGFGRRADYSDGHSMAGGVGAIVDAGGDDIYNGSILTQGAGYWWAAGFIEDLGGNDQYNVIQYSQGTGVHCGIGSLVDFSGDDRYNLDSKKAIGHPLSGGGMAHARDGSFGVFIDGDGNDQYCPGHRAGGMGNYQAAGLFWDRRGDDIYFLRHGHNKTFMSLGYPQAELRDGSYVRPDMRIYGVFLDTGGTDTYQWDAGYEDDGVVLPAADKKSWHFYLNPWVQGEGRDLELYERQK